MTITILVSMLIGALLSYANGANDISKGIATLVGSGVSDYRRALMWGTFWTLIGAAVAAYTGAAMLSTFGKGLLSSNTLPTFAAALATLSGAALWVLIATRTGLPVSTTHALIGSLVGVACIAYGTSAIEWRAVGNKVFLPLLFSPLVACIFTYILLILLKGKNAQQPLPSCICIENSTASANLAMANCAQKNTTLEMPAINFSVGDQTECANAQPRALHLTLDQLHWLSSGATSMARGMNDAPKIVALIAAAALYSNQGIKIEYLFLLVGVAMFFGCILGGKRVTQVLATKITTLDHHEGFAANLVTATLVTTGAIFGLPMSTTHVSSSGIVSAGFKRGTLDKKVLFDILAAWVITLPVSAIAGISSYYLLNYFIN